MPVNVRILRRKQGPALLIIRPFMGTLPMKAGVVMGKNNEKSSKTRRLVWDGVFLVFGSVCFGAAVSMFTAPAEIAPGGVTGLAVLGDHLFGVPAGVGTLLLNLPLLLLALRRMGRSFFLRTLAGLGISSVFIDLFAVLLPPFTGDRLLAAVFGGVLTGAGLGFIYMRGACTGGAEIVALLLRRKFPQLSIGNMLLCVDAAVVVLSALVYRQLDSALYAAVTVFLSAQVMDRLIYGGQTAKFAVIVSTRGAEIAAAVLHELHRGVTQLDAAGGYTGEKRPLLICAVGRAEAHRLRELTARIDPVAFVIFSTADEVFGEGFTRRNEE